jgi:hypothetical protein
VVVAAGFALALDEGVSDEVAAAVEAAIDDAETYLEDD